MPPATRPNQTGRYRGLKDDSFVNVSPAKRSYFGFGTAPETGGPFGAVRLLPWLTYCLG